MVDMCDLVDEPSPDASSRTGGKRDESILVVIALDESFGPELEGLVPIFFCKTHEENW